MDSKRRLICALFYDGLIALSATLGVLFTVFHIYFMANAGRLTEAPFFVTFTGLSNVAMGLVALGCFFVRLVRRDSQLPAWLFIVRMVVVAHIAITFLITAAYLAPSVGADWWRLYINGSLFNHLLTPLLSILGFLLLQRQSSIRFLHCLYSLIPMGAYGTFYFIRAYTHVDASGHIDLYYDIYGLARWGMGATLGLMAGFLALSFLLTSLLFLQNHCKKQSD